MGFDQYGRPRYIWGYVVNSGAACALAACVFGSIFRLCLQRLYSGQSQRTARSCHHRHPPGVWSLRRLVSRLRLLRHPRTGRAQCVRRPQARAAAHPARHARNGRWPLPQGGQHHRPDDAVPPARRCLYRRRARQSWAERPAGGRPGQLGRHPHGRQCRRAPLHRVAPVQASARHPVQPQDH